MIYDSNWFYSTLAQSDAVNAKRQTGEKPIFKSIFLPVSALVLYPSPVTQYPAPSFSCLVIRHCYYIFDNISTCSSASPICIMNEYTILSGFKVK